MKINNGYSIESIMNQIKSTNTQKTDTDNPFDTTMEDLESLKVATGETLEQTELVKSLESMGIEVTQSELEEIETFMNEAEGTDAEKLETVKMSREMGIDLTKNNLTAINEALYHSISDVQIPQSVLNGKLSLEKMEKFMKLLNIPGEVKEEVLAMIDSGNVKEALTLALSAVQPEETLFNGESSLNIEVMSEEDLLLTLVETVKETVDIPFEFPEVDPMTFELGDLLMETEEAEDIPLLENLDEIISQVISEISNEPLPIQSIFDTPTMKQYLVTETTEKIIEVKEDFQSFQKETVESLRPFVEGETVTKADLEQVMTKAIDKLDSVLMKSDIPLYTSMKDEKQLILMSSDLQTAKKMVAKGQYTEAKAIIKSVSSSLNEMVFKPQKRHVQGFVKDMTQLNLKAEEFYYKKSDIQMGARGIQEFLRGMGLNYDSEIAEKILGPVDEKPPIKDNLKQVLLELKETFEKEDNEKTVETVEKNLNNLNGQQLLNKEPQKNNEQTLHLNIPIVLADEMKDLKLFVQSRDANNKMDWENCTLYFAVDSGKYGKTGIRIKVQNRSTQVQVINENQEFKEKVGPLIEDMFKNLVDVGFVKGTTEYKNQDSEEKDQAIEDARNNMRMQKGYDYTSEKGLDFKI